MHTRDEQFSVILLDLGIGVLPTPDTTAFSLADLMQCVSKYRGFPDDTPLAEPSTASDFAYPVTLRRRRR